MKLPKHAVSTKTTLNQHKGSGRPNTSVLHMGYLLKTNSLRTENNIIYYLNLALAETRSNNDQMGISMSQKDF